MEKLKDTELVDRVIDENCSKSFEELLFRHEKLFYKICQKYGTVIRSSTADIDDLLGDKCFVFYKAITSYNPNKKTKFSTWLGNFTRYHCLNFINANCKYITFESNDFEKIIEIFHQKDNSDEEGKAELNYFVEGVFDILSKLKDKRIHEVYKKRYKSEDKQISTQTVINLHTRGRNILSKKMESKKYLDMI